MGERPTMTEKFKERLQREDKAVDAINDYCNETPLTVAEMDKPDELLTVGRTPCERWVVRYRRYYTDSWSERTFDSAAAAIEFRRQYLYGAGSDALAVVKHFIEANTNE